MLPLNRGARRRRRRGAVHSYHCCCFWPNGRRWRGCQGRQDAPPLPHGRENTVTFYRGKNSPAITLHRRCCSARLPSNNIARSSACWLPSTSPRPPRSVKLLQSWPLVAVDTEEEDRHTAGTGEEGCSQLTGILRWLVTSERVTPEDGLLVTPGRLSPSTRRRGIGSRRRRDPSLLLPGAHRRNRGRRLLSAHRNPSLAGDERESNAGGRAAGHVSVEGAIVEEGERERWELTVHVVLFI
nr:hypothetical protein Iba_chr02bCG12390 [Ipomoea batatas]